MTQNKNFSGLIEVKPKSFTEQIVQESTGENTKQIVLQQSVVKNTERSIQYKTPKEKKSPGRKPSNIPTEKITIVLSVATMNKIQDIALAEGRKGNLHYYRRNAIEAGIDLLHKQYEVAKEVNQSAAE